MEHPLFALKAGDKRERKYERNGVTVTVKPGHDGCATIHDKDLWIYVISQQVEALNRGREDVGRVVRFTAYDFLVMTNRRTDGDSYKRLGDTMARLSGTRIETNIETDGRRERAGFGLIDSWRVIERDNDNRMVAIEVTLPEWLWRSVNARRVLTLSRNYFRLRRPLDRRIYELARKHCGAQPRWRVAGEARFTSWQASDDAPRTVNRAGYRKQSESGPVYYIESEAFKNVVCKGFDAKAVAKALSDVGALKVDSDGRLTRKERLPDNRNARVYVITPDLWGGEA